VNTAPMDERSCKATVRANPTMRLDLSGSGTYILTENT
jgi:hypothetical protein